MPQKIYLLLSSFFIFWFQALEVARQVTGENDNHTAKVEFLKMMNSSEMFFSNGSIPPHESDKDAFKLCSSAEKAKEHCPHRWGAIQRWFTETREVTAGVGGGRGSALNKPCGSAHQIMISIVSCLLSPITTHQCWSLYPGIYQDADLLT